MSVKFKESTQWFKFFTEQRPYIIAKAVYYKNMTKNLDKCTIYKRNFVEEH